MSALNNQPGVDVTSEDDHSNAYEVLRTVMCSKNVREAMLRSTGVDVDMLEATFNNSIKPYLDYLHGYEDLRVLDPQENTRSVLMSRWDEAAGHMVAPEPWDHVLTRSGAHPRNIDLSVIPVVRYLHLWCYDGRLNVPSKIRLSVFMSRKGEWVLWYAINKEGTLPQVLAEQVFWFKSLRELWRKLHEIVPDAYRIDYRGESMGRPQYLPLYLERALRKLLEGTILEREKRLNTMKRSLEEAAARVEDVQHPHR